MPSVLHYWKILLFPHFFSSIRPYHTMSISIFSGSYSKIHGYKIDLYIDRLVQNVMLLVPTWSKVKSYYIHIFFGMSNPEGWRSHGRVWGRIFFFFFWQNVTFFNVAKLGWAFLVPSTLNYLLITYIFFFKKFDHCQIQKFRLINNYPSWSM